MKSEEWHVIATTLGFKHDKEMLEHFYAGGMSIHEISSAIGFSTWSVRRKLLEYGVQLRGRGGPHHAGQSKLCKVDLKELFETKIADLVFKYDVHAATVANERRRRRKDYAAFLRDLSNGVVKPTAASTDPPHGASPVPEAGPTISELLQGESEEPVTSSDS